MQCQGDLIQADGKYGLEEYGVIMTQYFRLSPETRNCYGEDEISLNFLPKSQGYRLETIKVKVSCHHLSS